MSFLHKKGRYLTEWFPKKTSTTITANTLLEWASGVLQPATAGTNFFAGVSLRAVASTDGDYATAAVTIPVAVPLPDCEFEVDVTGTALATTDVGVQCEINNALQIDKTATTKKHVTITKYLTTTKAMVKINSAYMFFNAA